MSGEEADDEGKRGEQEPQVRSRPCRSGNEADDAARQPGTSAASVLAVFGSAFAQVVGIGMNHHGATDDVMVAHEGYHAVRDVYAGLALGICLDVAQVADVPFAVLGGTMVLVHGIEVASGGIATVGEVSKGVNVKAVGPWLESRYVARDDNRVLDALLDEEKLHEYGPWSVAHSTTFYRPRNGQYAHHHEQRPPAYDAVVAPTRDSSGRHGARASVHHGSLSVQRNH